MEIKDIYLNSQVHKVLSLDISRGMLNHAYMLECADDFLLDKYAFFVAQEIFCTSNKTPCGDCNNCHKVEHGNMVDLKIYPRENKNIVVEDINEIVTDAYVRPIDAGYKVFLLKDFDKATSQSQNKLLKTLEEPPKNVIFILTCSSSGAILPTISSRVKRISIGLLDIDTASKYLEEINLKDASNVARVSNGNISLALKLGGKGEAGKIVDLAIETLSYLRSSSDVLKYSSKILALKKDFPFFLSTLISLVRDIAVCENENIINFENKKSQILALKNVYSAKALEEISHNLISIYEKLDFNCNITGVVDQMLLDILEVKFLCQK